MATALLALTFAAAIQVSGQRLELSDDGCQPESSATLVIPDGNYKEGIFGDALALDATCSGVGADRRLHLAATNRHQDWGPLLSYTLGFCGQVLNAGAPKGWTVSITKPDEGSHHDVDVEWRVRDRVGDTGDAPLGIAPAATLRGFAVRLSPGWRLAGTYRYGFESANGVGFQGSGKMGCP